MHKGMLMAIEKASILNHWSNCDIIKVKRLINFIEREKSFKFSKHNVRDTEEIYIDKKFLSFIAKALKISLYETFNTEEYCLKKFDKYFSMAKPILGLKYDIINIGHVDRCVDKGWWSIRIEHNSDKDTYLTDCYEYVKTWGDKCFEVHGWSDTFDRMCLKVGDKYFNPMKLK